MVWPSPFFTILDVLVCLNRYKYLPGAPFLIFACFNVIVSVLALVLYVREKLAARRALAEPVLAPVVDTKEKEPLIVQ